MSIVPTHSLYGVPVSGQTQSPRPGCALAPPGGMPYEDPAKPHCIGNNETCKAFPAKGTVWCVGHLKALDKAVAEAAPSVPHADTLVAP